MGDAHRGRRGGILGLVGFLDEHCGAVEGDLATYYGPDDQLHRLWTGGLSYRRLRVLIEGLPPESSTMTRLIKDAPPPVRNDDPKDHGPWSREMHFLAMILDELRAAAWQRGGDDQAPRPAPFPRPGIAAEKAPSPSRKRYLDKLRANQGAAPTKDGAEHA